MGHVEAERPAPPKARHIARAGALRLRGADGAARRARADDRVVLRAASQRADVSALSRSRRELARRSRRVRASLPTSGAAAVVAGARSGAVALVLAVSVRRCGIGSPVARLATRCRRRLRRAAAGGDTVCLLPTLLGRRSTSASCRRSSALQSHRLVRARGRRSCLGIAFAAEAGSLRAGAIVRVVVAAAVVGLERTVAEALHALPRDDLERRRSTAALGRGERARGAAAIAAVGGARGAGWLAVFVLRGCTTRTTMRLGSGARSPRPCRRPRCSISSLALARAAVCEWLAGVRRRVRLRHAPSAS